MSWFPAERGPWEPSRSHVQQVAQLAPSEGKSAALGSPPSTGSTRTDRTPPRDQRSQRPARLSPSGTHALPSPRAQMLLRRAGRGVGQLPEGLSRSIHVTEHFFKKQNAPCNSKLRGERPAAAASLRSAVHRRGALDHREAPSPCGDGGRGDQQAKAPQTWARGTGDTVLDDQSLCDAGQAFPPGSLA